MPDKMTPIPFGDMMNWILTERETHGSVFSVERPFRADAEKTLPLFQEKLETPFGPAAGPHTQLAQNIAAAYYAGARFFELKTVQIMDGEELSKCVPKPCILAEDEGYNCEWSTELTVQEAFDEYVKAWFLCKLMAREFGLGSEDGFIFNISVGYTYDGILSPKIDNFIEGMKDAANTPIFQECRKWALNNLRLFEHVSAKYIEGISPHVCASITLSTLHGCPPKEIERIAAYLINEKGLNTYVKCNPTILGYETARRILNKMGYGYIAFDDHHFKEDLQYRDAVPMFKRLLAKAKEKGVEFGLKLSNTFPVDVKAGELPSEEMYMSGRALYPLTIEMANRITTEFDGRMRLSFSGGVDAFNIQKLFSAGIWPITVATTALKPGGYQRMKQLAEGLSKMEYAPFTGVSVAKVQGLSQSALADAHHTKPVKPAPTRKLTGEKVPLTSCFTAPCRAGCPIEQDIPEYIELVGKGKHLKALKLICEKNPLPFITGKICSHRCMDKCTRGFYEEPVRIRNAKLEAARGGFEALLGELETPVMTSGKRAAIIGGGPAGLAAAYFLGRSGMPVTLYEQKESLGGIVRHVIPQFRISHNAIDKDVQLVSKMGVRYKLGAPAPSVARLKEKGYDYVLLATGAWVPGKLPLAEGEAVNVLDFLSACKDGSIGEISGTVLIVGGGNTAMDAARAAKRLPGVERVCIVYRRTRRYMPADVEELTLAQKDGVEFLELLSPVSLQDGMLTVNKMKLGAPDASGRRAPEETGERMTVPCDLLVAAVGEKTDAALLKSNGVELTDRGRAKVDGTTLETNLPGVYVIGDANRGPATVVEAIADARKVADHILNEERQVDIPSYAVPPAEDCRMKQGILAEYENASKEANRCLHCNVSCECCVSVCPNRANVAILVQGYDMRQIVHIERMCNECGNCASFCPYDSAPYLDKLTLFHTKAEMEASENAGFLRVDEKKFLVRLPEGVKEVDLDAADTGIPSDVEDILWALVREYAYLF